jgi:murein DD-endopeptidase MepM/ murein hydrolase activator NlpD
MKKFSVLMVPQISGKIKQIKISPVLVGVVVLFLILGAVSIVFLVRGTRPFQIAKNELNNMKEENQNLETQLEELTKKTILLKKKLDKLVEKEKSIRKLADIVEEYDGHQDKSTEKLDLNNRKEIESNIENLQTLSKYYDSLFSKISKDQYTINHTPTIRPVQNEAYISARFGLRKDPFSGKIEPHQGVNFSFKVGTPVNTTADGIVFFAGKEKLFGKVIRINHGSGFQTMYARLQKIGVIRGQKVKKGQKIGTLGNTGLRSIGPHLHYQVIRDGVPVDPEDYF